MGSDGIKRRQYVFFCPIPSDFWIVNLAKDLSFLLEFGIGATRGQPNYQRDSWLVGIVNSAPYIGSACM